jgi:hypothetical protein
MLSLRDWNLLVTILCYFPGCNSHARTYALGKIAVPFDFARADFPEATIRTPIVGSFTPDGAG